MHSGTCEAQFHEDFRLHLARFWHSLGTFFGRCLWSNLSRKFKLANTKFRMNITRGRLRLLGHFAYLHREAAGAAAAVRPKSEAQK